VRSTLVWLEAISGIWDWLWLRCARCGFEQSGLVKRSRPARDIGVCPCDSFEFVVLERRWNVHHFPDERSPLPLKVLR